MAAMSAAGADSDTLIPNAWVQDIALKDASLRGTELSSALAYAEEQGWLVDSPRTGWLLTREGVIATRLHD
jgi:hypothetical protein